MSTEIIKAPSLEHYLALVEELDALKTEEAFDMGMRHVHWAHTWGKTIRDYKSTDEGLDELLTRLSVDIGRSTRSLYRYVALFDRFPDLQRAVDAHGKNISVNLLLGGSEEQTEAKEEKPECDHSCGRHCK